MANTGSIPEDVCDIRLTDPVGAMARHEILRRPYVFISSYKLLSASLILLINGLFSSFFASYKRKAPLSFAKLTDER